MVSGVGVTRASAGQAYLQSPAWGKGSRVSWEQRTGLHTPLSLILQVGSPRQGLCPHFLPSPPWPGLPVLRSLWTVGLWGGLHLILAMGGLPGGGDLWAETQVQVGGHAKVGGGIGAPRPWLKEPGDGVVTRKGPRAWPLILGHGQSPSLGASRGLEGTQTPPRA